MSRLIPPDWWNVSTTESPFSNPDQAVQPAPHKAAITVK